MITHKRLKELFHLNAETGVFTGRQQSGTAYPLPAGEEPAMHSFPKYVSHKTVEASPIDSWSTQPVGTLIQARDGEVLAPADIFARGEPKPGDYLVVYADGYVSWSPKQAFEEGYARAAP